MKKILVIVDMQKDFTTGVLGNAECAATIPEVVKVVAEGNYDEIVLTKDTHDQTYLHTQEGKYLPVEHCIEGTEGWEIVDEIQVACQSCKNLHMVCKPTFGSLELGNLLKTLCEKYEGEETEIHFCGVCTGICVISNVMIAKAYVPEVRICVIENACACVTLQSHNTAIEAMKTCQVDMI
ncbi:MAG: cysteine hydrolase [Lachnobacterium sp.]|nr:cysteine hydrolase [Lachnobacterium sp.]